MTRRRNDVRSDEVSQSRIRENRILYGNQYAFLNGEGEFDAIPRKEYARCNSPQIEPKRLLGAMKPGARFTDGDIKKIVKKFQTQLWMNRRRLRSDNVSPAPLEILEPATAFEAIGYTFEECGSLGQIAAAGEVTEAAGTIDKAKKRAKVSLDFPREARRFTAAHELGHAFLHEARGLHRDRVVDGVPRPRDRTEWEADRFATHFLMPEKQVRARFRDLFGTENFVLTDETAFALNMGGLDNLRKKFSTLRDVCRFLASTEQYAGQPFYSLASQFGVSVEAMAIRLEELELVTK